MRRTVRGARWPAYQNLLFEYLGNPSSMRPPNGHALSVMRLFVSQASLANPSSSKTVRPVPQAMPLAAAPYRANGLVLWPICDIGTVPDDVRSRLQNRHLHAAARCGDAPRWPSRSGNSTVFAPAHPFAPWKAQEFLAARRSATTLPPRFDRAASQGPQQCEPMLEGMDRHRDTAQSG